MSVTRVKGEVASRDHGKDHGKDHGRNDRHKDKSWSWSNKSNDW